LLIVNSMPSRLERQAQIALRVREASEPALILALLDASQISEAAAAMGAQAEEVKIIRQTLVDSERVVVIFGDQLRGAAVEALPLLEQTLATPNPEAAKAIRQAHIDALSRQIRSTNSTQKPAINENPHTYIVAHPTLEIAAEPARTATKFSFVPLLRYANSLGAFQMGMASALSGGLSAQAMMKGAGSEIKALYLAGEDLVAKAENPEEARARLGKLELLVVQEMFLTDTAKLAEVVFPVTSFAESQGTQVNNGAQVQLVRRTIPPVGQARPDWMVVNAVAKLMGRDFGFQGAVKNIFKEIAERIEGYSELSHNRLANEGAIRVERKQPDPSRINRREVLERVAGQVALIDCSVAVDQSEMTIKAGSRLHRRYPLITRYSEMLTPKLMRGEEERPAPLIFPA
jgi:NADH dehydrogenase/NADH:ubiquinone oxidoreductase subunit G